MKDAIKSTGKAGLSLSNTNESGSTSSARGFLKRTIKADSLRGATALLRVAARGNAGQALVELALVFPLFILLLVAGAELGRLAYVKSEVVNAARAGVAYGAQSHISAADAAGMETAAKSDASNILSSSITFSPAPTYFCACSKAPGSHVSCTGVSARCSPDNGVLLVQVNTSATVGTLFHWPGLPSTITLRGQAIMTAEQ